MTARTDHSPQVSPFTRGEWGLAIVVFLTITSAPLEGYLVDLNPQAAKVLPVVLLALWVGDLVAHRRLPVFPLTSLLLLALLLAVVVSTGVNTDDPYILPDFIRWVPFVLLAVCLVDLLSVRVQPAVAIAAAITGALACAIGGLISFVVLHQPRAVGPMEDSNDLAYVLVAALPFVVLAPPRALRNPFLRVLTVVVLLAGVAATLSRGGFMAIAVFVIWMIARRLISVRELVAGLVATACGALVLWAVAAQSIALALSEKRYIAQSNVDTRIVRWEAAARILAAHPLFGGGPGGVRAGYLAASGRAELGVEGPVTHNMYLQVAADLGLVGFVLFCGLIFAAFVNARLSESLPWRREAYGVQASLITVVVASIFLSEQFYLPLWMAIALAASLRVRTQDFPVSRPGVNAPAGVGGVR